MERMWPQPHACLGTFCSHGAEGGVRGVGWRGVTGGRRLGPCQGSDGDKVTAVPGAAVLPGVEGALLPAAGTCVFPQGVEEFPFAEIKILVCKFMSPAPC